MMKFYWWLSSFWSWAPKDDFVSEQWIKEHRGGRYTDYTEQ